MKCHLHLFMLHLILNWILCDEITYYIEIGDKIFPFEFKNTKAANEIKSKIPFTINMTKLNGNEVFYYFNETFTTDIKSVGTINIGDVYLYQSNCLVLFYKTFTTTYSYTTIGSITNTEGLTDAIDSGSKLISWKSSADDEDDIESDVESDYEKDNESDYESDDNENDNESDDNESDYENDNESDNESDNENDDEKDNESDDESDYENDNESDYENDNESDYENDDNESDYESDDENDNENDNENDDESDVENDEVNNDKNSPDIVIVNNGSSNIFCKYYQFHMLNFMFFIFLFNF